MARNGTDTKTRMEKDAEFVIPTIELMLAQLSQIDDQLDKDKSWER